MTEWHGRVKLVGVLAASDFGDLPSSGRVTGAVVVLPPNQEGKMKRAFYILMIVLASLSLSLALNCGDDDDDDAPSSHTVNNDGVMHKEGLQDPETNCTSCHGADLKGGDGPSCYKCHGEKW